MDMVLASACQMLQIKDTHRVLVICKVQIRKVIHHPNALKCFSGNIASVQGSQGAKIDVPCILFALYPSLVLGPEPYLYSSIFVSLCCWEESCRHFFVGSSELDGLASVKSCNLSANGRVLGLGMEDSSVEIRAWPSLSKLLSFR